MNQYVIYNPQGGSEGHSQQYSTNLCLGLVENGVSVHLVTSRDYNATEVLAKGVSLSFTNINNSRKTTVRFDSWVSKLRYGWFIVNNNFRSFGALSKVLNTQTKAICLLVGGDTLTNILYLLANFWRRNVMFALTIHNADYEVVLYRKDKVKLIYKVLSKFFLKLLIMTRVKIFVHGEAMQKALSVQLKISIERISIYKVPTLMVMQGSSTPNNISRKPVRLLFCGVVRFDKGYDLLCEALSKCTPLSDWQLRIAGSVRQVGEDYVRNLPGKFGISNNCSFNLKYLTLEEIDAEFQACDLVVLPYRRGFIAQSVVMTDAIRWGKPVVVSEHSQNGYDALKYQVGWVFASEDVNSLEATLRSAISDWLNYKTPRFGFANFLADHLPSFVGRQIVKAASH